MTGFDVIPGRDPRLFGWAVQLRRAGFPARQVAHLFNIDVGTLIEAGLEP